MSAYQLRPPLSPQVTQPEVPFILELHDPSEQNALNTHETNQEIVVCLAAALQSMLPSGDLRVDPKTGKIISPKDEPTHPQSRSLWYSSGLLAGIDRSLR
ncbi:MAG: hypothetical protein ACK5Y6_03340 [Pseudomonadota bacterium]